MRRSRVQYLGTSSRNSGSAVSRSTSVLLPEQLAPSSRKSVPAPVRAYTERMFALPAMKDWARAAQAEVDAGVA